MNNRLIFTTLNDRKIVLLEEEGKAVEFRLPEEESEILGNIYIGKIKNIVKNISAAFVEIEPGKPCYLELKDGMPLFFTKKGKSKKPEQGDEVLVQISKDALKMKVPSLTGELNLPGEFLVLLYGKNEVKVSAKASPETRAYFKNLGKELLDQTDFAGNPVGILFRTNAALASPEILREEFKSLSEKMLQILSVAEHRTCYSCLYKKDTAVLSVLKDFYLDKIQEIVCDDRGIEEEIREYLERSALTQKPVLRFYEDTRYPLSKSLSLEKKVEEALFPRVWLKSGAFLIIEYTEALTVIDVNTGKYVGNGNKQKTVRKINREAAAEIARQLRLRNLSGIIVVDFINEEDKESEKELMEYFQQCLNHDPQRAFVVDMTKLGLVEVTRKKARPPFFVQWKRKKNEE